MSTPSYTSKDISVLTDREHVHKRLGMYAGNTNLITVTCPSFDDTKFELVEHTFVPAVHKVVSEVLDNSMDELLQIKKRNKQITIVADPIAGSYTIGDNGRGVPIDKHETGKYTPELVFGSLRSGRNFEGAETGVIGMNGMGASITNYCSKRFDIEIHRDSKVYTQTFSNGAEKVTKPNIVQGNKADTGTEVTFQLDDQVFKSGISIPDEVMRCRAMEMAFNNPGTAVKYCGELFQYKNGFSDVISKVSTDFFKFSSDNMDFYVAFDLHKGVDELMFTWVNSSLLFDGGLCNTQFINAFSDIVIDSLKSQAKKQKCVLTKNDVRQNLIVFGVLKLANPEYDAQSKNRLTGPNLRKNIQDVLTSQWKQFSKQKTEWLDVVLTRAAARHHSKANDEAIKSLSKNLKKKVPGLTDATSKHRGDCSIIITEGLSASSGIIEVRNPERVGSFPLTGKINNVYGIGPAELLKMGKITNLLLSIGLIPGKKAIRHELRFGKIIIMTDSDPDGADICDLLINLFFQFWPELFDPLKTPIIYRLVAPNVVLSKGSKRIHFVNRAEYEKSKHKYTSYTAEYMKGLGSMSKLDFQMVLENSECLIPFIDDGLIGSTLKLLFGDDIEARKEWLTN